MDTNVKSNNINDSKNKKIGVSNPISSTSTSSNASNTSTIEVKSNINTPQDSAFKVNSTVVPSNSNNTKDNTKECKIRFISKGIVYFEFNKDYVLQLPLPKDFNEKNKTIKITYTSDIGKPDFKYSMIK